MTTIEKRGSRYKDQPAPQIEFIAGIFLLLGLTAFGFVFYTIYSNELIVGRDVADIGTRFWNFMTSTGIVQPLLIITTGIFLIRLGLRLRTRHIGAVRWARSVVLWLIILATFGIFQAANRSLNLETATGQPTGSDFVVSVLPWGIILFALVSTYLFINHHFYLFRGDENITAQRTRTAWNLLSPTLLIFLLIGIGPLEQVFITSLTNERFASDETVVFVGFNNYAKLLGVRLDRLPCEIDETTGKCQTTIAEDGTESIVYPSNARRYLSDNIEGYRDPIANVDESVFRPVEEFSLFGTRYVFSVRDREFYNAFTTSIIYSSVAIFLQLVIGMLMAMFLTVKMRGLGLMRVALLVPLAVPTLIATQFWDVMLLPNDTGVINHVLINLGFVNEPQRWLLEPDLQLPAVIAVIVWKETPSMALLLLPGLLSISPEIYQAAAVDGANKWQQFWRITLPMMRPTIGVALVLRTMIMLRVFDVFDILLGTRRFSLATYTQNVLVERQDLGYSSTVSVAIFVIILFFTIIYMRSLRIDEV